MGRLIFTKETLDKFQKFLGHEVNFSKIEDVLATLPVREERALVFYFGFDGPEKERTYAEVGAMVGSSKDATPISGERTRQLIGKAIRRLRHPSKLAALTQNLVHKPVAKVELKGFTEGMMQAFNIHEDQIKEAAEKGASNGLGSVGPIIAEQVEKEVREAVAHSIIEYFRNGSGKGVIERSSAKFINQLLSNLSNFKVPDDPPGDPDDLEVQGFNEHAFKPINDLEISVRLANCLRNFGCKYVGEIIQLSERELLRQKNFGRKSLNELKEVLGEMGLSLGMGISLKRNRKYPFLQIPQGTEGADLFVF